MCLHTISKIHPTPVARPVWAWKKFRLNNRGRLELPFFSLSGTRTPSERVPRSGVWLKAKRKQIHSRWNGGPYTAGFHAFATQTAAKRFSVYSNGYGTVVVRVRLRDVHTEGSQDRRRVLVADRMLVPRQPKRKAVR